MEERIDRELVSELLEHLASTISDLEQLKVSSPQEFLSNNERYRAVKNALYEAVMDVISISQHIIASQRYEKPRTYKDTFRILKDNNVIPDELFNRIEQAGGFRIILAHEYRKIDPARIFELQNRIEDFRDFIVSINNYLESSRS